MAENTNNTIPEVVANSDSIFRIDDVYTVQRDEVPSTFLSGFLLKGTLHDGEGIVIYSQENKPVLTCKITGIERIGRDTFSEITFDEEGGNNNAYGIWVDNQNADLFKPGYYITSLVNGKNKSNKDRLTDERVNELYGMIDNKDEHAALRFLSIQELSAIAQKLNKENNPTKRDVHEQVINLLYKKISEAEELYITLDETTRAPFFNNGCVDIYSLESYADDAVDFYGKQFRKLKVVKADKENLSCPLFIWLTLLGVKTVTIDNGQHHVPLNVERFLSDEDKKNSLIEISKDHPPFFNPAFRYAMNICLSELRWPVNYPERKANCEEKDKKMWTAYNHSNLIIPIKKDPNNQGKPPAKGQVAIPHINNNNNEEFIALFTDIDELSKLYKLDDWGLMLIGPKQALELDDNVGLVINPMTENLIIAKDKLPEYREKILGYAGPNIHPVPDISKTDSPTDSTSDEAPEGPSMEVHSSSEGSNEKSGTVPPPINVKVTTTKSDGTVETVERTSNGMEGDTDNDDPNEPKISVTVSKSEEGKGDEE